MPATRAHLGVIFLTVLIDLVGFGIIMPILPMYAQRFGAQGIGYGALVFVFSAMQFLATALLGRLSDRIGRRPILLTTMLVNAAGYVLFAFAPSYAVLFPARSAEAILRESLATEHRTVRPLLDFGHMREALGREQLRPLMLVWLIAPFAVAGYTVALPLHATAALGWGAKELGWLFVVIGTIAAAVQGFLFGRIERRTGARALLVVGLFGMAVSIAAVPYAATSLQLYAWTVPLAF